MKSYTVMNLIHSMTGYYFKTPQRFESYMNAKIGFKQLHFENKESLLEEEITNLKSECSTLKQKYSEHIRTLGRVYLYLGFMVLVATIYLSISYSFTGGGIMIFIFKILLSLLTIPTLLMLWGVGFWEAGKGQRLAKRIKTLEKFTLVHSKEESKITPYQIDSLDVSEVKSNYNVLNLCLYLFPILEKQNLIRPNNLESDLYIKYYEATSKNDNSTLSLEVKNKKDFINTLTTFIISRKAEGRKSKDNKNTFGIFIINVENKIFNDFLSKNILLDGCTTNASYLTELSNGFNRPFEQICDDLATIKESHFNPFVDEFFICKEQINN